MSTSLPSHPITGTPPPRKPRGDARLAQLNPDQRELLRIWLEDENRTYLDVVSCVRHRFGIHVSKSAVAMYYQRHLLPDRHAEHNEGAAVFAALSSGEYDAVTITHAKALAWAALACPVPQIENATRLLDLAHRAEKQELARERLALEKQRLALRAQELGVRPPRRPRSSASESQALHAPSASPNPAEAPMVGVAGAASTPLSPAAPSPVSACVPLPPAAPAAPLPPPSLSVPSSPSLSSVPGSIPPNPPLFPAYSMIERPSAPSGNSARQPTAAPPTPALTTSPVLSSHAPVAPAVSVTPVVDIAAVSPTSAGASGPIIQSTRPTPAPPPLPVARGWPSPDAPGRIRWP